VPDADVADNLGEEDIDGSREEDGSDGDQDWNSMVSG
jgi:hypothetical protein